ncbi:DUF2190 family protein [Faecalibacterium sp. An122]|uniref:DUF2190 family protein n=1 Tax=Faecalibacterium sp. An122 TaxID=1965551 RepID=UPI000B383890|nr:DUF2190 family protein [Faecalibacterium sp. An122]OUQ35639.1 hypothetical protein B5E67_11625 [Faecalibacterium sp. An122]
MAAIFVQVGDVIDYTAAEDLSFGDVVDLSTRIGVAGAAIARDAAGPVQVTGVYRIPKATGAVTVGQALYWAKSAKNLTTTADSNTPAGWAVAPAESEDPDVLVKIG